MIFSHLVGVFVIVFFSSIHPENWESYNEFSISNQFSLSWKTFRSEVELGTELLAEDIFN